MKNKDLFQSQFFFEPMSVFDYIIEGKKNQYNS